MTDIEIGEHNGIDPIPGRCNDLRVLWPDVEAIEVWCSRLPRHESPHRSGDEEWPIDDADLPAVEAS